MSGQSTNLTAATLAEGRRLLEACKSIERFEDFEERYHPACEWLFQHAAALLSAAERTVNAETVLREIVGAVGEFQSSAQVMANRSDEDGDVDAYMNQATAHSKDYRTIKSIAARHNIDLGEPTLTGDMK